MSQDILDQLPWGLLGLAIAITIGGLIYDWEKIKNGRLKVRAYKNYRGKYCAHRTSGLVLIIKNPAWKKLQVEELRFFDESGNLLYSMPEDQYLEYGNSVGIDLGNFENKNCSNTSATKYVKVLASNGIEYGAHVVPKRWYHM